MTITVWDLFKYCYKWKFTIIIVTLAALVAAYIGVTFNQSYESTIIIQLTDPCINDGQAPDGSEFNINEIVSPNVLKQVIESRGLNKTVDALRSNVKIEPIIPQSEIDLMDSRTDLGERYNYYANTFSVTYSGYKGDSSSEVRDILEGIANSYVEFYNKKYMEFASINTIAYDEGMGNYDYLDMADMLYDNLDDIIGTLGNYHEKDSGFRSKSTGYTFSDLVKEYEYLNEFVISGIYSDIFRGQITKDKQQLINLQQQLKDQYLLNRQNKLELSEILKSRMDSFSAANKEVPNAYNEPTVANDDDLQILDGVYDDINVRNTITTYDNLIDDYVDELIVANDYLIKANRCDDIIEKFSVPLEKGVNTTALKNDVTEAIAMTVDRMNELNKTANMVIEDYNDYAATSYVKPLTGVNYYATLSFPLYGILAGGTVFFLGLIAAIAYEVIKVVRNSDDEAEEC